MSWVIRGLDPEPFRALYGLSDAALAERQVVRMRADKTPGFPCRITLDAAEPGETLLLLNHEHLPHASPYRSRHAIFVREGAETAAEVRDAVPEQLACRLLSVRSFDAAGMMLDADVVQGADLAPLIDRLFGDASADFIHVHNAKRGCFAARVERG